MYCAIFIAKLASITSFIWFLKLRIVRSFFGVHKMLFVENNLKPAMFLEVSSWRKICPAVKHSRFSSADLWLYSVH